MSPRPKAVVLLSGGLDSATTLAIAKSQGYDVYALSFRYGQRHDQEILAAKRVAEYIGVVQHKVAQIDLRLFGGSALTDQAYVVPKNRSLHEIGEGVPDTYVPARNTIFLSFALAWAEVLQANDIFIGVNVLDYSGYPDCRPEYIQAYETMARLATKTGIEGQPLHIRTPLIEMSKAQIIQRGLELGIDYSMTLTCYDPCANGNACGCCDACNLRLRGFRENGITDPATYQSLASEA
jgi:7-cyano-7-deazaguanine synthase